MTIIIQPVLYTRLDNYAIYYLVKQRKQYLIWSVCIICLKNERRFFFIIRYRLNFNKMMSKLQR